MEEVCIYFSKNNYSKKEISFKKKKIYQVLKENINQDFNNINRDIIKDMFILYDHIFLFDQFYEYLNNNNLKVKFEFDTKDNTNQILGNTNRKNQSDHTIILYLKNINNLINVNNNNDYVKIGGIKCYDRIQCLMNVFEHELVHLLIYIFCDKLDLIENYRKNNQDDSHNEIFRNILRNIFGHTQIYFMNLKSINMTQKELDKKIDKIKKKIKIGDTVESYQIDDKIKSGVVIEINENYVLINKSGKIDKLYFEYIDKINF